MYMQYIELIYFRNVLYLGFKIYIKIYCLCFIILLKNLFTINSHYMINFQNI